MGADRIRAALQRLVPEKAVTMLLAEETRQYLNGLFGQILEPQGLALAELASQVPTGLGIVEVGSYRGKSTCYLAAGANAGFGATVHAVDYWTMAPWPDYARQENLDAFFRAVKGAEGGHLVEAHMGESVRVAEKFHLPVGLLFLDGDHTFEGVCRDLDAWRPKLTPSAPMVFHDATTEVWGVARAIREKLLSTGQYESEERDDLVIVRRVKECA